MFAQAINRTIATAPVSTSSAGRTWPVRCSCSGVAAMIRSFRKAIFAEFLGIERANRERQAIHLRRGLCGVTSGLRRATMATTRMALAGWSGKALSGSVNPMGQPDLRAARKVKPLRHHADDGARQTVESDCFSENMRIAAQAIPPECIAQYRDWWRLRPLFVGRESVPASAAPPSRGRTMAKHSAASSCSGLSIPVQFAVNGLKAATSSKIRFCSRRAK